MAAPRRIGIEVDGTRATVVEVEGGKIINVRRFQGADAPAAIREAASGLRKGALVRALVAAQTIGVRRVDVTRRAAEQRAVFEDVAFEAFPVAREGAQVAGLLPTAPLVGETLGQAVAAVAPAEMVAQAYKALGRPDCELVPSAFPLADRDGVHLALRWQTAELTVVAGGMPVLHRALQTGGLERVAEALDRAAGGTARVQAVIDGSVGVDPVAENEVERYVASVAAEVAQTLEHWERAENKLPRTIFTFGPGATIPFLPERLSSHGVEVDIPDDVQRGMSAVPPLERPALVGAWLAATTAGDRMPSAAFVNPLALAREAARRSSERSARTLAIALAALAIIAALWFGPGLYGKRLVSDANTRLTDAQTQLSGVQEDAAKVESLKKLRRGYDAAVAADPDWARLINDIYANPPAGSSVTSVKFEPGPATTGVSVAITSSNPPPGPISEWIAKVSAEPINGSQAWSSGFTNSGSGDLTFSVNFTVPTRCLLAPHPNAPPGATAPEACPGGGS